MNIAKSLRAPFLKNIYERQFLSRTLSILKVMRYYYATHQYDIALLSYLFLLHQSSFDSLRKEPCKLLGKTRSYVQVYKNGPSKIYGTQTLRNLKCDMVCPSRLYHFKYFKDFLP